MNHQHPHKPGHSIQSFNAEQWVLLFGVFGFLAFIGLMGLGFAPLLLNRRMPIAVPPALVEIAAAHGFILPPTWTPTPPTVIPGTPVPTTVYSGIAPTPMYTPRATSLPYLTLPNFPTSLNVIDLARIMQGESTSDLEAAYYVGWVARNRLEHPNYGDTYFRVSAGFFGYRADLEPKKEFIQLAKKVIRAKQDPTGGCLYALSRTDITKLGVPPTRADVAIGEWFFFKTWPLAR